MADRSDPDITQSSPTDWRYLSEGGATIVFSYKGIHPVFSGTVLRLRKVPIHHVPSEVQEPLKDSSVDFQSRVISKLIKPEFLPLLRTVSVSRSWLEQLQGQEENNRPESRREQDTIDLGRQKAILAADLVGGDGWTVEIKPKWGFLPNPTHLSPKTKVIKSLRCRYCLHAHYRSLRNGSAGGFSLGYCPLDLYSGNDVRVSRALRCLWKGWIDSRGTFNNLRIFLHGQRMDPVNDQDIDELSKELGVQSDTLVDEFVRRLLPLVTKTTLLRDLSYLQRTLDPLDIEGLAALHDKRGETLDALSTSNPTVDEWESFVNTYHNPVFQNSLNHEQLDILQHQYYTQAYLLSATFKDCSIMLRLGRNNKESNIFAIDLEAKSVYRLKKWKDQDAEIASGVSTSEVTERCEEVNESFRA